MFGQRRRPRDAMIPASSATVPVVLVATGTIVTLAATLALAGIAAAISLAAMIVIVALVSRMTGDVASVLIVLVIVLLLVPARLRIAPLHTLGTPGALVGIGAFAIWMYGRVFGRQWLAKGPQPLRIVFALGGASVLASYLAMGYRLHDLVEAKAADRGIMTFCSMAGIALLAADGITNRQRLRKVLQAIAIGGAVVSGLGIVQFMTGLDVATRVHLPGFSYVASNYNASRSGFNRIVSTTSHPIELSVVLGLLLAVALHLVFTSEPGHRRGWIVTASMIGASIPMTVSRTAVITMAAIAVVLFPSWSTARRRLMTVVLVCGTLGMRVVVPGLIGTLRSLLFHSSNDPSLTSRTSGYNYAVQLVAQRPILGRGFGTFLPEKYSFLDDQILLSLVEVGVIGVVTILLIYATAGWATREVRRTSTLEVDRDLAQCLLACVAIGLATSFTFDSFSFPTGRTLLMLSIGLAGALWRIVTVEEFAPYDSARVFEAAASADDRSESAGAARSPGLA